MKDCNEAMPVPIEYKTASRDFVEFLTDVRKEAGLWSTHAAYTMVQGVFQTFRRRISVEEAIAFANVLPCGLRALFVADWDPGEPRRPFTTRREMNDEVRALRAKHNFATDTAISDVARVLWARVDEAGLRSVLAGLPDGCAQFWDPCLSGDH